MARNSMEKNVDIKIINIPSIAFRSFVHIAEKNLINGNLVQTLCYFLGPKLKSSQDEIWIDTMVIPMQICSVSTVEDNGIEETNTMSYLREMSSTKNKEVYAWVHSRPIGPNKCEFTSIDVHTQFILEKYVYKSIIGIIIQIRKDDFIWNAMNLNIFGNQRVAFCGKNFNIPFDQHKSCACECLYESCRDSVKLWKDIPFGHSKVMLANFLKEREPGKSAWGLATEPSDTESEIEDSEEKISCECCEKNLIRSALLKHISHTIECKMFYGQRFEDMKRKKNRQKMRKYRQKVGTEEELRKKREKYRHEIQQRQANKKKEDDQEFILRNLDRENVLHWKLAKEYVKTSLEIAKNEKRDDIIEMEKSIEDLYETFRLEIRAMYQQNKKVKGDFNDAEMKCYQEFVLNIPDTEDMMMRNANHKARIVKPNNKLCKQWYSLKSSIDENMKKIMKEAFAKTDICFCGIKDLPSDDIYGDWYGYPWLCQDDRKP